MWRKENPCALFGMKIGSATVEKSMEVSHKKTGLPYGRTVLLPWYLLRGNEISICCRCWHPLEQRYSKWLRHGNNLSIHWKVNKILHTHIHTHKMEYYLAIKIKGDIVCNNIDETWGHYTRWNKLEKGKYSNTI